MRPLIRNRKKRSPASDPNCRVLVSVPPTLVPAFYQAGRERAGRHAEHSRKLRSDCWVSLTSDRLPSATL